MAVGYDILVAARHLRSHDSTEFERPPSVVSVVPDTPSVIRLVGVLLRQMSDEMNAADRRYISRALPASRPARLMTNRKIDRPC